MVTQEAGLLWPHFTGESRRLWWGVPWQVPPLSNRQVYLPRELPPSAVSMGARPGAGPVVLSGAWQMLERLETPRPGFLPRVEECGLEQSWHSCCGDRDRKSVV